MRFFNTTGPVETSDHYVLDSLRRINYEEISLLIDQKKIFHIACPSSNREDIFFVSYGQENKRRR